MTLDQAIAMLRECRKLIPGPSHPADAAAADYLIGRLRGEYAGGSLLIISGTDPVRFDDEVGPQFDNLRTFHHGSQPTDIDVW